MFKQIVFALFLVAVLGNSFYERQDWTFEEYLNHFGKVYESKKENDIRRQIFEESMTFITKQNSNPTELWKAGVNKFSDMTKEEKRALHHGLDKVGIRPFSNMMNAERFLEQEKSYSSNPSSFDWRSHKVISAVKNQGGCGSCWAFATTETVESYGAIDSGVLKTLAPQQLVDCAPNTNHCGGTGGCEGSIAELGLTYLAGCGGQASESDYTYEGVDQTCKFDKTTTPPQVSVTGFKQIAGNDEQAFEDAIVNIGPLAVNVFAEPWSSYSSGIYTGCGYTGNIDIDHVVQAVGYGVDNGNKYWIVRNSWGPSWGEEGYIRLIREDTLQCGTDTTPLDGIRCEGYTKHDKVCGQCGVLYDPVYATGAKVI